MNKSVLREAVEAVVYGGLIGLVVSITLLIVLTCFPPAEPKTFEETYNKAYEQCLTEQQNNTKITNKEYYCVNYANAKVK